MHAPQPVVLAAEGLRKSYGTRAALKDVSLEAAAGERVACVGPNGAGKTTLLTILAGIQRPDAGTMRAEGRVGWVPQTPAVYDKLTAAENLRLFAKLEQVADIDGSVTRMLDQTGLRDRAQDQVAELSGGNRQRLNVAIGLLSSPPVLLMDEPSAALDPRQRERLWEYLGGLTEDGTTVVYATHTLSEAERHADRMLVLADGEALFWGSPSELQERVAVPGDAPGDLESAFVEFLRQEGHLMRVRTLLGKDLRILVRSPLLLGLLVVYPLVVALLIGLALGRGSEKPRVALVNEVPRGQSLDVGTGPLRLGISGDQVRDHIDPVRVSTREEAEQLVRDGDVLGALIIPEDTFRQIESRVEQPQLEVIVNEEDPVKARLVDDAIAAALAEANRQVARALTRANVRYLDLLLNGGDVTVFGESFNVLGLRRIGESVEAARRRLPRGSPERRDLDRVVRFTRIAQANFGLSSQVLTALSEPIRVDKQVVSGARVPLSTFAAAVAVAVTLMFVTVLLASGALALERDQNTFGRLVRGPVSRTALLAEKGLFALTGALPVTLLMLLLVAAFATVEWDRFHLWVAAIVVAAAAFAAMGTLIGALAREVQTASLLAFTLLLPVAFLALVPSGAVSPAVHDITQAVSFVFPFDATVDAMRSALYSSGSLAGPLLHLGALAVAFGLASRVAIRRFA